MMVYSSRTPGPPAIMYRGSQPVICHTHDPHRLPDRNPDRHSGNCRSESPGHPLGPHDHDPGHLPVHPGPGSRHP